MSPKRVVGILLACFFLILLGMANRAMAEDEGPIVIGGLFDLTGPAKHIGLPTKNVADMIVERINKQGGINGRKLELVSADTEGDPSKANIALKRLITKDKVVSVIGPTRTGCAMACINTIEEARIPTVACVGGDPPVKPVKKWVFKTPQMTATAVEKIYVYCTKNGMKKIGILTASDSFGQEGGAVLIDLAGKYGIEIVAQESFDVKDVDMTVQISKIAAKGPQALICWTIGPAGAVVAKNAYSLGIKFPLFQCHGLPDPSYIKSAGEAANGNIMPSTKLIVADQLPDTDPQKALLLDFIDEYENVRKYGKVNTHSGYAWDAVQIVAQAIEKAGTESEKLRSAIESTKNYVGVSGIYTMSPEDHCGLALDSMVLVKIENGQWKLLEY
ncbi:ABC transporter substrate-binding protein [bacterium]|nr:ABC transporter substrate-binding protein [bacterium]